MNTDTAAAAAEHAQSVAELLNAGDLRGADDALRQLEASVAELRGAAMVKAIERRAARYGPDACEPEPECGAGS